MKIGSDTRALVTGATKGIGEAIARQLSGRAATVGLLARSDADVSALAGELSARTVELQADVADRDAVTAAVARFTEEAGGLDVVFANAGIARYAPFADQDPEDADRMIQTNVAGTINTVRAALVPMLDSGRGHVVVISSGAALRAFPWGAVYGATKAANKGFAEALRHELSGTGVSVTTVFPGEVETSIHAEATQLPDWRKSDEEIPAEEVAEAAIEAVESDRREVHIPRQVRMLALNDLAPGLVDRVLAAIRGGSAAPRRY